MNMQFDALVVGGSFSGMSAALQLARARRRVAVVDAGVRRNRFAASSHGFLGQDGRPPEDIVADAKAQLLRYPNVQWVEGEASSAVSNADGFSVSVPEGTLHAKRLVLATGVVDELPPLDGLAVRWGRSVFHCPYCHGYELDAGRIGVLWSGPMSIHHSLLLPDWGQTTVFCIGDEAPDDAQLAQMVARGATLERVPVARLTDEATVELQDGRRVVMDGLFTLTHTRMASPLAHELGCEFEDSPFGNFVRRTPMFETTVPGVFACGDMARMAGNVAINVGDGAMVGAATHRSLIGGI
jgi:thioredoxin reductase